MKRFYIISVTLLLLLFAGQNAWAENHTVTYTMRNGETVYYQGAQRRTLIFTRSGNGFSTATEHTAYILDTGFTVDLDDGLRLQVSWESGASMTTTYSPQYSIDGFLIRKDNKFISKDVKVSCGSYYITHVKMAAFEESSTNIANGAGSCIAEPGGTIQGQTAFDVDMDVDLLKLQNSYFQATISPNSYFARLVVTIADTPREYPITYVDAVDGQNGVTNTNPTSYNVATQQFRIRNDQISRTGYTLAGLYKNAQHTQIVPGSETVSAYAAATDKARTYYAVWTPNTYTVRYHKNDGTDATVDQVFTYGTARNLDANAFTRAGYNLAGWNTVSGGSGTSYTADESVINLTAVNHGVVDLYAQWVAIKNIATSCEATVPNQTLQRFGGGDDYPYIYFKFEDAANGLGSIGETVKDGNKTLVLGTDYQFGQITFAEPSTHEEKENPCKPGDKCRVEIIGKGNYEGTLCADFMIVPPPGNGTWGDNLTWSFDSGTLSITGSGYMATAPSNEGYPWYQYARYITTISVGGGINSIADAAFAGTQNVIAYGNLTSVSLPSSVVRIGSGAFAYCTELSINLNTLPGNTVYGDNPFNQVKSIDVNLTSNDNSYMINALSGARTANVTISFYAYSGSWFAMCLPFDIGVDDIADSPLAGATILELDPEATVFSDGKYYLNFKSASSVVAGKPFLIKWEAINIIQYMTFNGVRITGIKNDVTSSDGKVKFVGVYDRTYTSQAGDVFITSGNWFVKENASREPFRAYIQLTDSRIEDPTCTANVTANGYQFILSGTLAPATTSISARFDRGGYWASFYSGKMSYTLPDGACAYTMDSNHHLYLLGTDGRTIPAGVAVVIIADRSSITLTAVADNISVTDHSGGNILRGSDSKVPVSSISGTPYVLGVVNGAVRFYGTTRLNYLPAHKAYYVTQ